MLGGNIFEPYCSASRAAVRLELAEQHDDGLVVTADQDELAHSIRSVGEVIARALRTLREAGLVLRVPAGLLLTDPG